ncbi:hypothetical protein [Leyella stercorea]|uniref:hypothetical protein n=1 Tax=Leyella stercorea TaxID=363265 RepID=UPI002432BD72|nr:hypothetical protein [Leyella stercorea]
MGKKGATLSLPAFNFDVEKIIIKKNTGSVSGKVTFNIFVDNTAVSTQAKGCDKDKTFIIKDEFQKAGNIYTIKVTNANNLQTSAIEIYKKAATTPATTTTFGTDSRKTFTFTNGKLEGFTAPTATATKSDDNTDLSNLIEYTSSDADIVAVDSKTGELTFTNTKFGKAAIIATLPKTDTYKTSTDSYFVENKDNHIATSLSFNGTDVTLTEGKTDAGADFTGYTATEANNIAGTITYAASGDAVATVNETTGAVTVTPSVYGTTTITATFTPADPTQYSGSTATYKITNKKGKTYYTTLAAMKEAVPTTATNNAPVTLSLNLTDAIVTSVVGKKAAIQDATAGILVYGNNAFDLVKGKKYTGKVDVKAGWFNGYVEIVDWTPSADIVVEDAAELPLETITLAQFKANPDKYEFKRVKVSKVTTTTAYSTAKKATITQDGTDATLFGETTGLSVSINTIYDLIGCAYHHKTSYLDEYRIGIFAQEDITEIVKETPALSFAEATVTKELTAGTIDLQTITKPEDLDPSAITYASSDNETAEVYEGQILMYKTGEVTITATSAATDKYAAGTASYKLVIEDNRATDADFKFAAESYSADLAEATDGIVTFNAANVLQNPNNLKVTYTISPKDENVEIDASTGYIVISKRGIYTITATGDATNTYKKTTTTCTLKVINSAVEETSIEFVAGVDKGTQTGTGNEDQIVQDVVTIHGTDAAFAAVSSNKYTYRLYQNCTTTISTKIGKITKIEFVKGDKPINNLKYNGKDGAFTADTKYDLCWVGSAKEVVFTNSSQARATKIIVTVEVPKAKNYTLDETKTDNVIETYENANVTLQRTLEASHWNSFCVPFALDKDQVTQYFGEGTQLRTYEGRCENNIVYFATVDNIEAGKPYIMKPGNAVVKNPTFEGVSMVATGLDENGNPQAVGDASTVQMKGIYNHVTLVQDKTNIYIGAGNKFYYPADAEACQMNGLRAYFIVPEGTDIKKLRANLDGATTSLGEIFDTEESNTPVYNLQGQCVGNSLSTLKSGIYVQNGKKVVVK